MLAKQRYVPSSIHVYGIVSLSSEYPCKKTTKNNHRKQGRMASYWGQNRNFHFVASKSPTHVETYSSGFLFRFFLASFSWLGRDALFLSSLSSLHVVVLLCWCRHVARLVIFGSSCRRVATFVLLLSSCRRVIYQFRRFLQLVDGCINKSAVSRRLPPILPKWSPK